VKTGSIKLNGKEIQYRVIPKNNKNTYFKFRKDGTIEITKSRYQSTRQVLQYMKQNAISFASKIDKVTVAPITKEGYYHFFGTELAITYIDTFNVKVDVLNDTIFIPSKEIDPDNTYLRKAERNMLLFEIEAIKHKYLDNPYVDIKDITIKTRHTKTRFGSCNARTKSINLNANLVHYDIQYLEYVFLHEIAHLVYQNHSKEYYGLLKQLCPNYKQIRKELREIYR
jgi:predicted metal-dependent hydrolase